MRRTAAFAPDTTLQTMPHPLNFGATLKTNNMQSTEWLLVIVPTIYLVLIQFKNMALNKAYILGGLISILLIHLVAHGYRWQMIPGYLLWILAAIAAIRQRPKPRRNLFKVLTLTGLVMLFVLGIFFPSVLPVFDLPTPTGPYTVGTKDIALELDRPKVITPDESDQRKIMVKAWYPSRSSDGNMDPYADRAGREGFARKYGLPSSTFNYLNKVETHVYRNIPVADEQFPILIFSHGYHSKANGYYALLSEIVSHGYVVFTVNHTYESTGSTFPDGTKAFFDNQYAQDIQVDTWETVEPAIASFKENLSFEERHPIVKKALLNYFVKDMVARWAHDLTDVIDYLEPWNNSGFFQGNLNVAELGVFGHSRGGGAAGQSLLMDDRIKAGTNLDGIQWGPLVDTMFQQPFLYISSDWPEEKEDLNQHVYINKSKDVFHEGRILGTGHSSFMDIPFMVPVQAVNQAGSIDPQKGIEIASSAVKVFFDRHLKHQDADVTRVSSKYEALQLTTYTGNLAEGNH